MEHYIFRDNIESKIQKLIDDRSVSKKLFCLYGVEKIGKTFTLEYVRNEMLKNALVMFLPLNYNNISNPIFLKNSILQLLNDTGIANEKNFNAKEFLLEMFKGLNLNVGAVKYDTASFIGSVGKAISNYESIIQTSLSKDKLYIEKMADIVSHVLERCQRMLYVLIDNIHNADMQIWAFLDIILMKNPNLGLFLTYDRNFSHDTNRKIDSLVSNFVNMSKANHELREFEIDSTKRYLEKKVINHDIDYLAKQVQTYTAGIPGYISILTNDIETLGKIRDNRDFISLMTQVYENLTEDEQNIVKYIHLNDNEISFEVLEAIAEESTGIDVEKAIDSLVHKKGIVKEHEDFYELKLKLLINNITKFTRTKILKQLYNVHLNSNLKSTSEHTYYINIIRLSKAVKDYDKYFEFVVKGSSFFIKHFKYEIAADFLGDALNSNDVSPNLIQKIQLLVQYVEVLFFLKDMKKIIEIYESLSDDELECMDENYSFLRLKISNAYYYENNPSMVYSVVASVKGTNEMDALKKTSILCASYDLEGDYAISKKLYNEFIYSSKRDIQSIQIMNIFIQMVEDDYDKCIEKLDFAINYFENYPKKPLRAFRYLAAAYNNKGIELLMNSNDDLAASILADSCRLFEEYFPVELHFPLNNIGLYHLLARHNVNDALASFFCAYQRAISPLQKGYVAQNIASAYLSEQKYEEAKDYINEAVKLISRCPDPIAKNYVTYNMANINKSMNTTHGYTPYLEKPQLELLNIKRGNLNQESYEQKGNTNRRKFFSTFCFEPCELMFYD